MYLWRRNRTSLYVLTNVINNLQWWPTYDGQLSSSWNDAFPYPLDALGVAPPEDNGSRTGDRPIVTR